ncbi:hypothetical protein [Lamprocystis purpurea]|uniref:hypothetical protein n=1 Tax=Lamprocystis purpurea TaxID=61598 RepID=UPI0003A7EBC7|nr:hypothetical protein [Lamprocystis purpurea]
MHLCNKALRHGRGGSVSGGLDAKTGDAVGEYAQEFGVCPSQQPVGTGQPGAGLALVQFTSTQVARLVFEPAQIIGDVQRSAGAQGF